MKKNILKYTAALALAVTASSCQKNQPDEEFLESDNLCLIVEGRTVHRYDPLTWQLGFSEVTREFRVHNDSMSDYYILICKETPVRQGQTIHADIIWSGSSTINSKRNLTFEIRKTDSRGRIWLWSKRSRIAVSVMSLR